MVRFHSVTFGYNGQPSLFSGLNLTFSQGFTALTGANGSGKSTLLKLACGLLKPATGHIEQHGRLAYLPQGMEQPPAFSCDNYEELDNRGRGLYKRLKLNIDDLERWATLSPGERRRWQLAVVLWQEPDILCLDEISNHLDEAVKKLIKELLLEFKGTALMVDHDRHFLNGLAERTVLFNEGQTPLFSPLSPEAALLEAQKKEASRLLKAAQKQKADSDYRDAHSSKCRIDPKDHSAKAKINAARLTGKDKRSSQKYLQLQKRADEAGSEAASLYKKSHNIDGITFQGETARSQHLLWLPPARLPLGDSGFVLHYPELTISNTSRIAVTGPNGSGKSLLISFIRRQLAHNDRQIIYMQQEFSEAENALLKEQLTALNNEELGGVYSALYRLGGHVEQLDASHTPSPGESRKLLLALGERCRPYLIILDEPTNHLDLLAVMAMETALKHYKGALLMVSHDRSFVKNLCTEEWRIGRDDNGESRLAVTKP
jgi:macrolide transport system ATP-binding/permease protein